MIGNTPFATPSVAESRARPVGILNAVTLTRSATPREDRAATHAGVLKTPSITKNVTSGMRAIRAESKRLPPTGAGDWWNIIVLQVWSYRCMDDHIAIGCRRQGVWSYH